MSDILDMKSSGPRPGRAFCGARNEGAGLMKSSGEAITMYFALAAGLRAVLARCWPGSSVTIVDMRSRAISSFRCRAEKNLSGAGWSFFEHFVSRRCERRTIGITQMPRMDKNFNVYSFI